MLGDGKARRNPVMGVAYGGLGPVVSSARRAIERRDAISPHHGPRNQPRSVARFLLQQAWPKGNQTERQREGALHARLFMCTGRRLGAGRADLQLGPGGPRRRSQLWSPRLRG